MKKIIKNKKILLLVLTIIMFLGVSLASIYFMYYYKDNNVNSLVSSMISVKYTENSETVNLENLVPVIDPIGEENTAYTFTVKNTSNIPVDVDISVDLDSNNTSINVGAIRYSFYINDKRVKRDNLRQDNLKVYTYEGLGVNSTINCKIVFWVDYYYDIAGETFAGKINVEARSTDQIYKEAIFLPGEEFNVILKQLAGNEDATVSSPDYNITHIVRTDTLNVMPTSSNVISTSDSDYQIYAWYDNGTIYYYTEALTPYINTNAGHMFRGFINLTHIDISTVDTSKVQYMNHMFMSLYNIEDLDLRNFNTDNVITMASMFYYCNNLRNLNISTFNTTNVTNMGHMFRYNYKIVNLDINNFNMSNVTDTTSMMQGLDSLASLKTPKVYPNSLTIYLPKTLYDESNNAYTSLNSTSPTETWLKVSW